MTSILLKQAGHPDFLRDHATAHDLNSLQRHKGTIPRCLPARRFRNVAPSGLIARAATWPFERDGGRGPEKLRRYPYVLPYLAIRRGHMEPRNSLVVYRPTRRTGRKFSRPPRIKSGANSKLA
ncbi:hypothetical protein BMF35_a1488 [Aurantiacibacter gangjinensis]|nr:hypothetical protein BMF35_a1488 [Aurantiacibacter gangjinensis]